MLIFSSAGLSPGYLISVVLSWPAFNDPPPPTAPTVFCCCCCQELVLAAGTQDVQLSLEDHHNEAYQEPTPPKVKVFSGAGRVLGNPTPRLLVESTSQPAAVPSAAAAAGGPQLNESSPITQIQVRLPDGSR